ncbi:MAG: hypothetical protein ACLPTF_11000 [Steroidobacteraceae bacterium]
MEIPIAIELIAGVIFVIVFGCKNLERELTQRYYQRLFDSYDEEGNDAARK